MKETQQVVVRQKIVRGDEMGQVTDSIDTETLMKTLRRFENRFTKDKVENVRAMIIRRVFEEICYPPVDVIGLMEWFEDTLHVALPTAELKNLLKYIGLYKPLEHQHPKDTLAHFLKECDLAPPTPLTQVAWVDEISSLERYRHACQMNPNGEPPPTASVKVRTEERKMSKVLSFIGSMWVKVPSSPLNRKTNNSNKSSSLMAKVHVAPATTPGAKRRGRRGTV
eukprot:CAMPEP_0185036030 /NCGR_PEP_ID=MMETSP1103-20130426/28390_1 /TAXON_ID=36769 /ORGANISM="Paraphysomonas bandaiensis, Strain Caron Lab Isolate" /LENGTH=223 /DNA_ID=CAMNT_0027573395 /DNA_START=116 /DNA_END=787 /DNA_ORIENTATION=+